MLSKNRPVIFYFANSLKSPAVYIIIFLLAFTLVLGVNSNHIAVIFVAFFAAISLVGLFFSKNILALGVLAAFGAILALLANNSISVLAPGCLQVRVSSRPSAISSGVEFAVADKTGRRALVQASDSSIYYNDQVKLCFESSNVAKINPSQRRYYLGRYRSDLLIQDAQVVKIQTGSGLLRLLYLSADWLSQRLNLFFKGNTAALAKGLILGGTGDFSQSFKKNLQASGTSHLVAVSGYNVSIITVALFGFLRLAFSRRFAITSTIVVLIGFCLMTGATASVVRASIMGLLFVFAKLIGRRTAAFNSLFAAALVMVLINPFTIYDVGFQLSFAATFGLVVGSAFITLPELKKRRPYLFELILVLITTILAQIFTLPILLMSFGRISILAPIANLLILPLVPFAMALIALVLAVSFITPLAILISELAGILLRYFISVITYFGQIKWAAVEISSFALWKTVLYYLVLLAIFGYLTYRGRIKINAKATE
jgi:ComEC/Rec2-related protein